MMDQKPVTIVVSDLHMGAGDASDDFVHQGSPFTKLIDELTDGDDGRLGKIELIINGDFLEMAQVNPGAYQLGSAEFWCSEIESTLKLDVILQGHADVFDALKRFQAAGNRCTLFAGNHDVDLYWQKVQALITAAAGPVNFELEKIWYGRYDNRLRISHGHMFDPANSFDDWSNPIRLGPNGINRLEMCPGTLFMVKFVNWLEAKYPFADNVHPSWRLYSLLKKEAKFGFVLAAWLLARFSARHPGATLGIETDPTKAADYVLSAVKSDAEFRRRLAVLSAAAEPGTSTDIEHALQTADDVERLMTAVIARVPPDVWMPVFDGVGAGTLKIVKSGIWKSKEALQDLAVEEWKTGAEIVTIGHTHEADTARDGKRQYYNTGSWTRYLPWSRDKDLTLDRLLNDEWFPYDLLLLRVEQTSSGALGCQYASYGTSA